MRCVVGVLVWLLASSAIAGEQAEPHTGTVAVAVHSAESGRASADEHGAGEGFERAAAVLRRYQAVLSRQQLARNGQRARPRTYRDLSGVFPAVAQPYVRGAMRLFGRLLGLVDEGSAYQGRAAGPQPQSVQEEIARVREFAAQGHEGAQLEAAEMELYGRYGAGADLRAAFERYQRLAEENGSATAQYMLGIFYATGLGGVDQENSLALLYMTLAAMQGHTAAEATLGFKHLSGIGVPVACGKALGYYQLVARKAIEHYQAGPPLGRALPDYRVRLADDGGGTYGVRTGPYALHKVVDRQAFGELLLYHQQNARDGNLKSCITLVDLYYHGHRFGPSNFSAAMRYARQVQQALFTGKQGELRAGLSAAKTNMAAQVAGMLGIMHLRGEGTAVNTAMALKWLTVGARLENALSLNALGVMYRDGLGVAVNMERAMQLFKRAAEQRHLGGLTNLGLAMMDVDPAIAHESLKKAAEGGHLLAHFHLGELYAGIAASETQCRMSVASYKFVAENGDWLHSPMPEAAAAYQRGDLDAAVVEYIRAAEMGYGAAQQNVALLLEAAAKAAAKTDDRRAWSLFGSRQAHVWQTLAYWTRAANQDMPDARVKQGDHYYHGWGVERSAEQAAAAYTLAAEADANGLAMWNLGWMHEHGIGVKRDFYLAKRWYDRSIEANQGGKLANHISLARLAVKYLWAWASGEDVGDTPLFFAPEATPEAYDDYDDGDGGGDGGVGHAAAGPEGAPDAQAGQLRPAKQPLQGGGDGDQGHGAAGTDDFGMDGEAGAGDKDSESNDTLSGNIFFVLLLLAAGGMFLPFR